MSGPSKLCLVLRAEATRADFERVAEMGFEHHRRVTDDPRGYEQVWAIPNIAHATGGVHDNESAFANWPCLVVGGANAPEVAACLAERLPVFTHEELRQDALDAATHNDKVRAIHRLALGFVYFDPVVLQILAMFALRSESSLA